MRRWLIAAVAMMLLVGADKPAWRARRRPSLRPNLRAAALISPEIWPSEPNSPSPVDLGKLARALRAVCGQMPPERAEHYAEWIQASASRHGEDPFLLAALMLRASRCLPEARGVEGIGLTAIPVAMYAANVRGRALRYEVPGAEGLLSREKLLPRPLLESTLSSAETNLEWAAALLAMWREQHEAVDKSFEQTPHRHYLSHFIWGDRVKSARAEDRILTDRRRILLHYGEQVKPPETAFRGLKFGAPLESSPRVVSSEPGADRDEGLRLHRGVDVEAMLGEPVLAIADGQVAFAGVDLPGLAHNRDLPPARIALVPRRQLGRGGRYVCITHLEQQGDEQWLRSCYMHLEEVAVRSGQRVQRGQVIGTVGRTGMKRSAPHLHLEIKSDKRLYDARDVLSGILVGEPPDEPRKHKRRRANVELVTTRP